MCDLLSFWVKKMKRIIIRLIVVGLLFWSLGSQAQTVYQVNRTVGAGTIMGTIETDGTLGPLSTANIVTWSFDAFDGTDNVSISSGTGFLQGEAWSYLSATDTELVFDFDGVSADPILQQKYISFHGGDTFSFDYNLLGNFVGQVEQLVHQFDTNGEHRVDSPTRLGQVVIGSLDSPAAACSKPLVSMGEVMSGLQAGLTGGAHTEAGNPESFFGAVNIEDRQGFIVPENGISSVQCDNDHILIGEWFATRFGDGLRFATEKEARDWVTSLFGGRYVEYYFEVDGNRVDHMQTGTKIGLLPRFGQLFPVAFFNAGLIIQPYSLSPGPHTATAVLVRDPGSDGVPPFIDIRLTADFTIVESAAAAP